MTVIDTYSPTNSYQVVYDGSTLSYAATNAAAAGNARYQLALAVHNILHNSVISGKWYIRRADLQFDTSTIPAGATITAASLTFFVNNTGGADTDGESIVLVDNTNTSMGSPANTGDFDLWGSVDIGSVDVTTIHNLGANYTLPLTSFSVIATGAGAVTRLGMRMSGDIAVAQPTGQNLLRVNFGSDAPYLDVTWSVGGVEDSARFFLVM